MFTRTTLSVALVVLVILGSISPIAAESSADPVASDRLPRPTTSLMMPALTIENAPSEQVERVSSAMGRYREVGLDLPDLEVVFSSHDTDCQGAKGLFTADSVPWRITICSLEVGVVVEHELAHAWERANVDDQTRDEFMQVNGYAVWSGQDVPWNERAMEGAAVVIQQGVSGLPLPPALGSDAVQRLRAFEILTGQPDPRLVDWIKAREVSCSERPTPLSASVADGLGRTCAPTA